MIVRLLAEATSPPLALLALLLSACIVLPIPTGKTEPRYSSAQLEFVQSEAKDFHDIGDKLGPPDLRRGLNRIWIYDWKVESGMLFVLPLVPGAQMGAPVGPSGPIHSDRFVLVLEFNEHGMLRNKDFAHKVEGGDARYCTERQVCVEHTITVSIENGFGRYGFHNDYSAVTVNATAKEEVPLFERKPNECLLTVWPDKDWDQPGGMLSNPTPRGLALQIGGSSLWPRDVWAWLPAETFAQVAVSAGTHEVKALNPDNATDVIQRQFWASSPHANSASFECNPGDSLYLAIGASKIEGFGGAGVERFPIVLRRIDPLDAQVLIAKMPQVLLP